MPDLLEGSMRGMLGLLGQCILNRLAGRDQLGVILDLFHVGLELLALSISQVGPGTVMMMVPFLPSPARSTGIGSLDGVGGWCVCTLILSLH